MRAAKEAFPDWSAKSPAERSKVLNKLADLIEARLEEFAQAESKDQGKTLETLQHHSTGHTKQVRLKVITGLTTAQ